MHYPAFFDGKIAIQPIDPSIDLNRMGQRNGFSTTDKSTINAMYPAERGMKLAARSVEPGRPFVSRFRVS